MSDSPTTKLATSNDTRTLGSSSSSSLSSILTLSSITTKTNIKPPIDIEERHLQPQPKSPYSSSPTTSHQTIVSKHLLELQREIKEEEEEIFADINSLLNGRSNLYSNNELEDDHHHQLIEQSGVRRASKHHQKTDKELERLAFNSSKYYSQDDFENPKTTPDSSTLGIGISINNNNNFNTSHKDSQNNLHLSSSYKQHSSRSGFVSSSGEPYFGSDSESSSATYRRSTHSVRASDFLINDDSVGLGDSSSELQNHYDSSASFQQIEQLTLPDHTNNHYLQRDAKPSYSLGAKDNLKQYHNNRPPTFDFENDDDRKISSSYDQDISSVDFVTTGDDQTFNTTGREDDEHPEVDGENEDNNDYQAIQSVIQQVTSNLPKPCVFFLEGNCRRSDCKYSHDLSNITCKYWIEGFCFKGEMCPFLHSFNTKNGQDQSLDDDMLDSLTKKQLDPTFAIESEADFPSLPLDAPTGGLGESGVKGVALNPNLVATNQILNPSVVFKTVKKKRRRG